MSKKNLATSLIPYPQDSKQETANNPGNEQSPDQSTPPSRAGLTVRAEISSQIEISLGWYKDQQVNIVDIVLEHRKKLYNILKNHYIHPAYIYVERNDPARQNICTELRNDLLFYLLFIQSNPSWEKYLPVPIFNQIYQLAYNGNWHNEQGLIEIRNGIHQALEIPPREKTTDR